MHMIIYVISAYQHVIARWLYENVSKDFSYFSMGESESPIIGHNHHHLLICSVFFISTSAVVAVLRPLISIFLQFFFLTAP